MPKARTKRVEEIKQKLIERLQSGYFIGGDRFFSNRHIANQYAVSYMTAHKLLKELEEEGYLERKEQSGSFVSGVRSMVSKVAIYAPNRIHDPNSYSHYLFSLVSQRLDSLAVPYEIVVSDCTTQLDPTRYAVVIDLPCLQDQLYANDMFGLFLNDKPTPGLSSVWVDSVYCDNYSGGVAAAELFHTLLPGVHTAVFAGPQDDWRNRARIEGYLSIQKNASIISANTWHEDVARLQIPQLFQSIPEAVFCCNDKLAAAVISYCNERNMQGPHIIGFDNLPISETMGFSTIAVPWDALVDAAVSCIQLRLQHHAGPTRQIVVSSKPILRGSLFALYQQQ
jgi:hypothetical protein